LKGRVYIETYGCALNYADTAIMRSVLASKGYTFVNRPEEADIIILNTCTVRLDTEQRMRKRITELSELAEKTGAKLIVAGCMASAQPYTVKRLAPKAVLVSTYNVHHVDIAVEKGLDLLKPIPPPKPLYTPNPRLMARGAIAEIPIEEGCLGDCSFCITKIARRRVYSRPIDQLVGLAGGLLSLAL